MKEPIIKFKPHEALQRDQRLGQLLEAHKQGKFQEAWDTLHNPRSSEKETHKFSSVQVELPKAIAQHMHQMSGGIHHDHLNGAFGAGYGGASAADGLEMNPHVTLLYGLHTTDPEDVKKALAHEPPIKLTIGRSNLFRSEEGDVLKMNILSEDLHRLNAKLAKLPHTNSYPKYEPHATVAYLKPGTGKHYAGDKSLEGKTVTVNKVTFSGSDGNTAEIKLGGTEKPPVDAE